MIDVGLSASRYLAHITLGVGRYTLWLNIVLTNWKGVAFRRDWQGSPMGHLSVFTFALTTK